MSHPPAPSGATPASSGTPTARTHRTARTLRLALRRALHIALWALGAVAALAILVAAAGWVAVRRSLPDLDGTLACRGLAAPVQIERDRLGIPTIKAANREDLARATGFVHAQDRFFQMDLMRRRAAGELSELIGRAALPLDKDARVHRFRSVAEEVIRRAEPSEARLLEAYAEGVNAGLASLRARPFEYLVLRMTPVPWRAEDSALVLLGMFNLLQGDNGNLELGRGRLHDLLPAELYDFLVPRGSEWDAPLDGSRFESPAMPGPAVLDLRRGPSAARGTGIGPHPGSVYGATRDAAAPPGSNNFAVAGTRTADGRAILADDMHLPLAVPGTWYRAALVWDDPRHGAQTVSGLMLPGTPAIVVGSNGHVAWGFTNTEGDWSDIVLIEPDPANPDAYRAADGYRPYEHHREAIRVRGGQEETLDVRETSWGPILGADANARPYALHWVAHDPDAVNFRLMRMERARALDDAIAIGHLCGIPAQNLLVADRTGRIGWTIAGAIPRRSGFDGSMPASWADGARGWAGWLRDDEIPTIVDPPDGYLCTANARVVGGDAYGRIGDGGLALGARAAQIRDDLASLARAGEHDLLAIQLDDRARFLSRWQELLRSLLAESVVGSDPHLAEARRLVEAWAARAATDSAGYRLVREFRRSVGQRVFGPILKAYGSRATLAEISPQYEAPLWALVTARPEHLLSRQYQRWDDLLMDAALEAVGEPQAGSGAMSKRTWGERNRAAIRHPLSLGVPVLGRWLDMPRDPLPGDSNMPRVQSPSFGASERMVVAPGHEADGILELPCGQSGHPLSAHYADQHQAWVKGEPSPFLPGEPEHRLVLEPAP